MFNFLNYLNSTKTISLKPAALPNYFRLQIKSLKRCHSLHFRHQPGRVSCLARLNEFLRAGESSLRAAQVSHIQWKLFGPFRVRLLDAVAEIALELCV